MKRAPAHRLAPRMVVACELCSQIGGQELWRDKRCRVVLVEEPDYPGFCRVIWNTHIREMTDLPPAGRQHCMRVVLAVETALREVLEPHKINLASLGNMTPHLHWHVIPRFEHDAHFPNPVWGKRRRPRGVLPQASPSVGERLTSQLLNLLGREKQPSRRT